MKYIATSEADKFLMEKSLQKGQGVTFDIFEDPEEEEEPPEQYDDDGNVIPVVKKEPEPRTIFVPDLLMGPLSDRVVCVRVFITAKSFVLSLITNRPCFPPE
jgi:hypothetical protein